MTTETPAATDYTGPDQGFGEDNAIADEIVNMDWYADSPTPHNTERMGLRGWELPTSVEGLSPEMADAIRAKLAGLTPEQRAQREPELIREALQANSRNVRILTGLGSDATPLAKAQVSLAAREDALVRRIDKRNAQLAEVTGWKSVADPTTGKTDMKPIYRLSAEQRHVATLEVQELNRQLAVLQGPEGARELAEALRESVEQVKQRRQQQADLMEIDRMARESIREEDLKARAAIRAKHLRGKDNYSPTL